ncbi:hypothetical protein [Blastococcus sp. VKM Ac-2987]|uniref:hypothetical protein n=1 Tax=Blastococcus sp. VKM Ac-2987 TaxID=3004141 RepID=UPI0022AB9546|nr:hypothetical protein [Blastococcus sp. VKM Ac-2987]MCZ2857998.1 hypothetical protein [Blastococcus sp. VKM Ac-2987]
MMTPGLVEMLAAHLAAQSRDGGWMFTGEGDQPPHPNTVGHRWCTAALAMLVESCEPEVDRSSTGER